MVTVLQVMLQVRLVTKWEVSVEEKGIRGLGGRCNTEPDFDHGVSSDH